LTYFGKHLGCLLIYVLYVLFGETRSLFDFDWSATGTLNLVGAMMGGFIAVHFMVTLKCCYPQNYSAVITIRIEAPNGN
jgi:uncharacterized membrane protein